GPFPAARTPTRRPRSGKRTSATARCSTTIRSKSARPERATVLASCFAFDHPQRRAGRTDAQMSWIAEIHQLPRHDVAAIADESLEPLQEMAGELPAADPTEDTVAADVELAHHVLAAFVERHLGAELLQAPDHLPVGVAHLPADDRVHRQLAPVHSSSFPLDP